MYNLKKDINIIKLQMINYFGNDKKRINHFLKVHSFACLIGQTEQLKEQDLFILEIAALTHDIGIKISEEKYSSSSGKYQEAEGPNIAKELLGKLYYKEEIINEVCYLIGHHHTYDNITDIKLQILIESDFLVNAFEDNLNKDSIIHFRNKLFKTKTGISLLNTMYI